MSNKIKIWLMELRAPFFTATIVPVLLGAVIALAHTGHIHWGYFVLTLVGGLFLHAGANVANDYYDHLSGDDEVNTEFVRPFTGGSRVIQNKLLTPREVITGALIFFALGSLIGIYLTITRGTGVLILGVIGIFSGFFYTAPPLNLVNRGIGELLIGLNFGILMTLGSYYVQTKQFALEPVVASIPVALLIAAVLFINEFQDHNADKQVGKNQWVVRLGRKKAALGYLVIFILTYLSVVVGVVSGVVTPYALGALLTVPLAYKALKTARTYFDDNVKLVPANAATVMIHLFSGLLLSLGYVIETFISKYH
ncbi:MAG: 1,4-dihydroxy-2-naphthoate octaprenyltransferase [candidate division KSB1 bacterium]|nr:1,4-dihydroxy-2-naphthoate octaprenyltransferase [candidate division KSB1 bacterium]